MLDAIILDVDLWAGDESDYRVLANRMVVTRASHTCAICLGRIAVGSRVRASRETYDGRAKTFYVCPTCGHSFVLDRVGRRDGRYIERRVALGRRRAETKDKQA